MHGTNRKKSKDKIAPIATIQVGVVPKAPKSVSSPNSTRDAVLLAFSRDS